ncbi:Ssl1-domain-containing protein, partial [Rhodotorula sp. JG-1b]
AWEGQFERTWDQVQEDEHGTLEGAVSDLLLSNKSRRVLRDTASIQRGIIRHVYLVIDLSSAMLVRDYKATWLDLTLQYAQEFVTEFFDQNPIGQMAIMVTRDGLAERLTPLSGNPADHLKVLQNKKKLEPRGQPSLQNVLQLAKNGLSHLPPHGSREVIIILGSLTTCDPTNIHDTISQVEQQRRIRVNIIGLSADVKICRDICDHTRGVYRVARDDLAFRDLLFEFVSPPPTITAASSRSHLLGGASSSSSAAADLMQMGFPALLTTTYPGVCACHGKLKTSGYGCPRCKARLCDVPTECRVCGLTVVNAPQLARSYRHLFPFAKSYGKNRIDPSSSPAPRSCFSCTFPFSSTNPANPTTTTTATTTTSSSSSSDLSPLGRYACPKCGHHFCLECDKVVHEALGFCPGC